MNCIDCSFYTHPRKIVIQRDKFLPFTCTNLALCLACCRRKTAEATRKKSLLSPETALATCTFSYTFNRDTRVRVFRAMCADILIRGFVELKGGGSSVLFLIGFYSILNTLLGLIVSDWFFVIRICLGNKKAAATQTGTKTTKAHLPNFGAFFKVAMTSMTSQLSWLCST